MSRHAGVPRFEQSSFRIPLGHGAEIADCSQGSNLLETDLPSAMIVLGGALKPPSLADDLRAAGITVHESGSGLNFVQCFLAHAPDMIIMHQHTPDAEMFEKAANVAQLSPCPVIVFTPDPDADNIARAMTAGVHAYIINGYSPTRLRSVIHLAQARFQCDQLVRDELAQVNQRFEECKLVDRAKAILMGTRQLREEEAYRVLRRVAMHTKQRIGQVSQRVIDAARYGEAINRAGQLRMLSQRAVKLYALTEATASTRSPNVALDSERTKMVSVSSTSEIESASSADVSGLQMPASVNA
ncbi:MAG: ANTAR domain-containing protein [Oxalobacteraceae bacterium]|nr:MAG: ANTAR domain-containing protein [Oxalobacteraceae bacterium]